MTQVLAPVQVSARRGVVYPMLLPQAATDAIQRQVAETRRPYEEDLLEDLVARCGAGTVVDVGANVGNHTLYLLHSGVPRVVACEPDPELAETIRASAEIGDVAERVSIITKGISDAHGEAGLSERDDANIGQQHLVQHDAAQRGGGDARLPRT